MFQVLAALHYRGYFRCTGGRERGFDLFKPWAWPLLLSGLHANGSHFIVRQMFKRYNVNNNQESLLQLGF